MSYLAAIGLNNIAIIHLSSGSCFKAHDVLNQAMQCLNDDAKRLSCPRKPLEGNPSMNPHVPISYEWVDFSDLRQAPTDSLPQKPISNIVCRPFLCHLVVKINIDSYNVPDMIDSDIDSKLRWAINYNLGVLNHYAASCLGERGNFLLQQAHHFYTTAQLSVPRSVCYTDCFRLLLSTQNNLICIYLDFGMHEEHRSSLKILTELMMSLPCESAMEGMEMNHEILLNLMVLSRLHMAPAA